MYLKLIKIFLVFYMEIKQKYIKFSQKMVKKYHQQGYTEASVVEGNGRFRIALYSYSDKNAAYQKMESLKKEAAFKSAWMLSSK